MIEFFRSEKFLFRLGLIVLVFLSAFLLSFKVYSSDNLEGVKDQAQEQSTLKPNSEVSVNSSEKHFQDQVLISERVLQIMLSNATSEKNQWAASTESKLLSEIESLRKEVRYLKEKTESYKNDIDNKENSSSSFLISSILTGATLIITALAVGIALFSFYGYRKLLSVAEDKAQETAITKTREIIEERVKQGQFDDTISDAIEMIAMRGIFDPSLEQSNSQENKK